MMKRWSGVQWRRWWAFVALCALAASRWGLPNLMPAAETTALSSAIGCASAFVALLTYGTAERIEWPRPRSMLFVALAGGLMFGGISLPMLLRVHTVDAASLTIALAAVPVVVAIARPAFRQTRAPDLAGRLWPGLAAVAGMLLILPEPSLASGRDDLLLAAAPVLAGVGAAWLRSRPGRGVARAAAALGGAAVMYAVAALARGIHGVQWREQLLAAVLDGLVAWLSVLALLRLGATRWSAQFELVPLLVLLEGVATAGMRLDVRALAGLVLLGIASVFLLIPPRAENWADLVEDAHAGMRGNG